MRLTEFVLKGGVIKDETPIKAEGYAVDTDKARFYMDGWQPVGGWELATPDTFTGIVRGAYSWADRNGLPVVGFGTAANLYTFYDGDLQDVTPFKAKGTLLDPFTVRNGSTTVLVFDLAHGLKEGDPVTFANADAVGGITIDGEYVVARIIDINRYEITHGSAATSDVANGGGVVEFSVPLDTGNVSNTGGFGYGVGEYGEGSYGEPIVGDIESAVWSLQAWGRNDLLAVRTNSALYQWQPATSYPELMTGLTATLGSGWTESSGTYTGAAGAESDLEFDLTSLWSGGLVYELTFTLSNVTAGTIQPQVTSNTDTPNDVDIDQPVSKDYTYTRRFRAPQSPTKLKFQKSGDFAGDISAISVKLVDKAYRINSAPQYSRGLLVDANGFAILYGTIMQNGQFDALGVRWSDLKDIDTWLSSADNYAGEDALDDGTRVIGGVSTRRENILLTDKSAYSLTYTRELGNAFEVEKIGTNCGLVAKNAIAEQNGRVFWWATGNRFYAYQGGAPQIIKCPISQWLSTQVARQQRDKIQAGVVEKWNEIWWLYPDQESEEVSRYVAYNWVENHFVIGTFDRTSIVGANVYQYPIMFSSDGEIFYHELGQSANGDVFTGFVESAYLDLGEGDNLFAIQRMVPDFEDQRCDVDISMKLKQWPNSTPRETDTYTFAPTTEKRDMRHKARHIAFRMEFESNTARFRTGRIRLGIKGTGARR